MKTAILYLTISISSTIFAQQKGISRKGLPPSQSELPNYEYVESFDTGLTDNLALLIQNIHESLMVFHNNDSTIKSRPIVYLNGEYLHIESLVDYKQSNIENIEIEFMSQPTLTAIFGTSAINGYGIIKIRMKENGEKI